MAITLTKTEARRFMLAHQGLYPPRNSYGKQGILNYIQHVGCIQFDPINVVGRNPDLVLQSRIKDYKPKLLDELLYKERKLSDGWDKMASIYPMEDWPNFWRYRNSIRTQTNHRHPNPETLAGVLELVRQRGPLSSLDLTDTQKVDWYWGPTSANRAALEYLYSVGNLGINHRTNNRRHFNLIERLVPENIFRPDDAFNTLQEYQEWHILRRIGGMGLVNSRAGDHWLGILGVKSPERNHIIERLISQGSLTPIKITDVPRDQTFFIRSQDLSTLEHSQSLSQKSGAAIVAALDNLIWNRALIRQIFEFEYTWEVYKPKSQRTFGYYVLPVLFGDQFVARFEPAFDKQTRVFSIQKWWWEDQIKPHPSMQTALVECMEDFLNYLDADQLQVGDSLKCDKSLDWINTVSSGTSKII